MQARIISSAQASYHAAMRHLLSKPARTHEHGDGCELDTRPVVMSVPAAALWIEFYNQIETEQASGAELQGARAFASKAAEHAARIAGIVEVFGNPDAHEISVDTMAGAVAVMSFYLSEHVRLTGAGIEDRRTALLRTLLDWLTARPSPVPAADVLQATPRHLRALKAEGLKPLLAELAERGYIRAAGKSWEVRR